METAPLTAVEVRRRRLAVAASAAGVFVEWFDLMIFSHLSSILAQLFFPQADKTVALLQTYVVFALGFLVRPLGGVFIGRWGDLYGRKQVLFYSVLLMSIPMLMTAVLPTYADIGVAAPLLLCLGRLMIGFSAGGEWTGTLVTLMETTQAQRRGITVSIVNMSSGLGTLASSLLVLALSLQLSPEEMLRWGWRVPFVVGGALALLTMWLRRYLQETPAYEDLRRRGMLSRQPFVESLRLDRDALFRCLVLFGCGSLTYYLLLTFLPGHMLQSGIVDARGAYIFTTALTAALAVGPMCFALIVDRFGSGAVLRASTLAMAISVWPLFLAIGLQDPVLAWISCAVFVVSKTAYTGSMLPVAAQSLPAARRFTGLSLTYNLAVLVFGGTAPAFCTALIVLLGDYAAAAYICLVALCTAAMVYFRGETTKD